MDYKLSAPQRAILESAATRADGSILPLPPQIKGIAILNVIKALTRKGLVIYEGTTANITEEGLRAIGASAPIPSPTVAESTSVAPDLPATPDSTHNAPVAPTVVEEKPPVTPRQRPETKQAKLIAMLNRSEGATLDQIIEATGWQRHTIRGAISGTLRKKLGLTILSERIEGQSLYRIKSCLYGNN